MTGRFETRVAVVTGGGKGIGLAVTKRLAKEGAKVVLTGRDGAALESAAREVRDAGGEAHPLVADAAVAGEAERVVEATIGTYGRADILVNNAGVTRDGLLLRMSDEDWDVVMETNLKGAFRMIRAFARPMVKQRWGRIVNVSSVIGLIGNAGQANYAASKAGLLGLTKAVAKELASRHITVNAVAPGFIETAMTGAMPLALREAGRRMNSLRQGGQPVDVAETVAFFASPASAGVNGNVVRVCGQSLLGA